MVANDDVVRGREGDGGDGNDGDGNGGDNLPRRRDEDIAEEGKSALLEKDQSKLVELMNLNFELIRKMFVEECLGEMNIEMVEVARRVGEASKFTGSGGAVVVYCPQGESHVKLLEEECRKCGFIIEEVKIAPSCLNDTSDIIEDQEPPLPL
ncbi:unnamed protein product [Cochlearia groenlandica]